MLEGVGRQLDIWAGLTGQIYLGDEDFVSTMQNKIGQKGNDWSIPKKQKRPLAPPASKNIATNRRTVSR